MSTNIEWVRNPDGTKGETWNFIRGCTEVSPGCAHCYAKAMAARFSGPGRPEHKALPFHGFARMTPSGPKWTGKVSLIHEKLDEPFHWEKPRTVFPCSMSDVFHEALSLEEIAEGFRTMAMSGRHSYLVLTKRIQRAARFFDEWTRGNLASPLAGNGDRKGTGWTWPLENVALGTTIENQSVADLRAGILMQIPATLRFLSVEPMLGPLDLKQWLYLCRADLVTDRNGRYSEVRHEAANTMGVFRHREAWALHWVICGAESGPDARPMDLGWARALRDQCADAEVPFFMKQICRNGRKLPLEEWPEDLRIRQWPTLPRVIA